MPRTGTEPAHPLLAVTAAGTGSAHFTCSVRQRVFVTFLAFFSNKAEKEGFAPRREPDFESGTCRCFVQLPRGMGNGS